MLVVVCGDRNWKDSTKIKQRLEQLPSGSTIIEGGARGADVMAGFIAKQLGFAALEITADWSQYGKTAGPMRNREMLDLKPDLVIAFHSNLAKSRGTADTVREARRRGIPVEVIE